jgi:predicted transcriptional regulator
MLTKSIPTKFDEHDLNRLNYIAKLYDRSVSYLIREATREYLDNQAKKLEFLEEAKLSLNNYKNSGLHASHKEMKSWLHDLAKGQSVGKPLCHK